ncbi:TfoX/Sxy family protein [Niveibacterium sp.]|uniref:TfoX/Sxy family protein n=1 Tax=Niveibacterium sp. TaxID=2017444 RepID=UPI0035B3C7E7
MSPTAPPKATLDALRNLGPRSREMLAAAGIHSIADLSARGAVRAWDDVRRCGQPASLNLLWALVGALEGRDWRNVARHDRLELLTQIEAITEARKALRD